PSSNSLSAAPPGIPEHPIRSAAEHSGTKQRRNSRLRQAGFGGQVDIEKFVWETKTISRVGYGELGVAAINRVTGEFCAIAKIFAVRPAISALTIGPAKPWNADAIAN